MWHNTSRPAPSWLKARSSSWGSWLADALAPLLRRFGWSMPSGSAAAASLAAAVHLPQRDADLAPLRAAARHGATPAARAAAAAALAAEEAARAAVDAAATRAVEALLQRGGRASAALLALTAWHTEAAFPQAPRHALLALQGAAAEGAPGAAPQPLLGAPAPALVAALVSGGHGRPGAGVPLVDSWDCLRGMVGAWEAQCGALDQYGMHHTRLFANLCNAGLAPRELAGALGDAGCSGGAAAAAGEAVPAS